MKTVEIDDQLEQVLKRLASMDIIGLNLLERMEISIFVEMLSHTPKEIGRPEYRVKYIDILGK